MPDVTPDEKALDHAAYVFKARLDAGLDVRSALGGSIRAYRAYLATSAPAGTPDGVCAECGGRRVGNVSSHYPDCTQSVVRPVTNSGNSTFYGAPPAVEAREADEVEQALAWWSVSSERVGPYRQLRGWNGQVGPERGRGEAFLNFLLRSYRASAPQQAIEARETT
jgi:hypothetical protein